MFVNIHPSPNHCDKKSKEHPFPSLLGKVELKLSPTTNHSLHFFVCPFRKTFSAKHLVNLLSLYPVQKYELVENGLFGKYT